MPKFREESFATWALPPSDSEAEKLANAERMIGEAITDGPTFSGYRIEVFGQGSYANDTNVRLNSDIDINVRLTSIMEVEVPEGKTMQEYGYKPSPYTFGQYRSDVWNALARHFGAAELKNSNKCIKLKGNSYRVQADIVPTLRLDEYFPNGGSRTTGCWLMSQDGRPHYNFAPTHLFKAREKNAATGKRFKRLCRIVKSLRYRMVDEQVAFPVTVKSFLLECLLYQVPNSIYNDNTSWTDRLRGAILWLYNQMKDVNAVKDWLDVSGCLYLFHDSRGWTAADVSQFLIVLWNYLEFT